MACVVKKYEDLFCNGTTVLHKIQACNYIMAYIIIYHINIVYSLLYTIYRYLYINMAAKHTHVLYKSYHRARYILIHMLSDVVNKYVIILIISSFNAVI